MQYWACSNCTLTATYPTAGPTASSSQKTSTSRYRNHLCRWLHDTAVRLILSTFPSNSCGCFRRFLSRVSAPAFKLAFCAKGTSERLLTSEQQFSALPAESEAQFTRSILSKSLLSDHSPLMTQCLQHCQPSEPCRPRLRCWRHTQLLGIV